MPIATPSAVWMAQLKRALEQTFGLQTRNMLSTINLQAAYDAGRRQYNSSQLLLQLLKAAPPDAAKILGVAAVDLFIPILTYVFGKAQLNGSGAVVSLQRLNSRFYGLAEDTRLLRARLIKEAVHELGHTFGLLHCSNAGCALNASTYVEDIDQKTDRLCNDCRQHIADHRISSGRISDSST